MLKPFWSKYKTDILWIMSLNFLILVYFYNILDLKMGFYSGDHRQQHYPWAFFYAAQLKQGMLPWWTSLFGCGFPLLAEGQVGALYPLNLLFYKFFPFDFAYTYNILFHYGLGALFFYIWMRQQHIKSEAAFGAAVIYLFGTAQGGFFYNIISLKTLIWFPLSLCLTYRIMVQGCMRSIPALGCVFAMQWLGGYLQYAVYSIFFCGMTTLFYFFSGIRQTGFKRSVFRSFGMLTALFIGILIALPQLSATLELSRFSNRFDFPIEFAFIGSMNPLAAATLFFPQWDGFLGAEIYFGAAGIFFLLVSLCEKRNLFVVQCCLGFLLALGTALGQWNPLFKLIVEAAHLSMFRVPTKFLYFAAVFGAALCGRRMHIWLDGTGSEALRKAWKIWIALLFLMIAGWGSACLFFQYGREFLLNTGKSFLERHYQQSVIHPFSMETYVARMKVMIGEVASLVSFGNRENQIFLFWTAVTVFVFWIIHRKLKGNLGSFLLIIAVLYGNLWSFGDTSIRGSLRNASFLSLNAPVMSFLKDSPGRVHRIYRTLAASDELAIVPHNHLTANIALLGAYSPLVFKSYYEWMRGLGDVNDSNVQLVADPDQFLASSGKVNDASVEWILSDQPIGGGRYDLVKQFENQFLYRNSQAKPRIVFSDSSGKETAVDYQDFQNRMSVQFESVSSGRILIRDQLYPGWRAALNGKPAKIDRYQDFFRAIEIPGEGNWKLEISYRLFGKRALPFSVGLFFVSLISVFPFTRRRKGELC